MKRSEHIPLGRALMDAIFNNPQEIKLPWYRRRFMGRLGLMPLNRSKYEPHQSDREKARRLRQREGGMI